MMTKKEVHGLPTRALGQTEKPEHSLLAKVTNNLQPAYKKHP
jgi:hypothetical protein